MTINKCISMKFEVVKTKTEGIPYISPQNARILYDLIVKENLTNILELGVAHGTSTCYMAAALDEIGDGLITAVDLENDSATQNPSLAEQANSLNLSKYIKAVYTKSGYSWFLHDEIVRCSNGTVCNPVYDLCIIDGPKNWTIDGGAFFLVNKLLKPGGWIIFDDYNWTYATAARRKGQSIDELKKRMSESEMETPHIREIFELLVKQEKNYTNFVVLRGNWALAQKVNCSSVRQTPR